MAIKEITEKSSNQKTVTHQTLTPAEADAALTGIIDVVEPHANKIASMPGGGLVTFWCRDNPSDGDSLESGQVMGGNQKHLAMTIAISLVRKHPDMTIRLLKCLFDVLSCIQSRSMARSLFQSILDIDVLKYGGTDPADKE